MTPPTRPAARPAATKGPFLLGDLRTILLGSGPCTLASPARRATGSAGSAAGPCGPLFLRKTLSLSVLRGATGVSTLASATGAAGRGSEIGAPGLSCAIIFYLLYTS